MWSEMMMGIKLGGRLIIIQKITRDFIERHTALGHPCTGRVTQGVARAVGYAGALCRRVEVFLDAANPAAVAVCIRDNKRRCCAGLSPAQRHQQRARHRNHTGGRTGQRHRAVLEVIEYRAALPEAIVLSAYGAGSGWLLN